jgi:hypothetical protein
MMTFICSCRNNNQFVVRFIVSRSTFTLFYKPDGDLPLLSSNKRLESVLFIGTQYSNLYTAVDTPAEAEWLCVCVVCKYVLERSRATQPPNLLLCLLRHFGFLTSPHDIPTRNGCHPNSSRLLRRSTSAPHPIPRAHFLHLPTSPRLSLCTSTMTTNLTTT